MTRAVSRDESIVVICKAFALSTLYSVEWTSYVEVAQDICHMLKKGAAPI